MKEFWKGFTSAKVNLTPTCQMMLWRFFTVVVVATLVMCSIAIEVVTKVIV